MQKLPHKGGYLALSVAAVSALTMVTAATVNGSRPAVLAGQQASASSAQTDTDAALQAMVGKPAPAFSLPDQNDKAISLEDTKGKWVVLAFYPVDMSAG